MRGGSDKTIGRGLQTAVVDIFLVLLLAMSRQRGRLEKDLLGGHAKEDSP